MKRQQELDLQTEFGTRVPGIVPRLVWALATHKSLSSATRGKIRKSVARRYPGPFDVTADGVNIRAYPFENYCDRIAVGRGHLPEIPERTLIGPLLGPGMVFVDIGANIGTYSLYVAERCADHARIVSFEPHPRTFAKLGFNIRANGYSSIEAINEGVGAERGQLSLYSSRGTNIGTASMLREAVGSEQQVDITVAPLGETLASRNIDRVDLLKIDIEGFEDRALLPFMAAQNKARWPAAILIETVLRRHWQADCVAELTARGYTIAGDTGENVLLLHPMTEKLES